MNHHTCDTVERSQQRRIGASNADRSINLTTQIGDTVSGSQNDI
jgi:hypothetical protein